MNKIITLFVATVLLSSCYHINTEKPVVPEKLLTHDQMSDVITQIQIAEAGFKVVRTKVKLKNLKPEIYNNIIEEFDITMPQLKQNLDYYNQKPEEMELIYDKVLEKLSKIQEQVEKEVKEQRVLDSIASINDSIAAKAKKDSIEFSRKKH